MKENNYDFNNSMEEEKEKEKAIEEANNTMISSNKEKIINKKKKKEKAKKGNKIVNLVDEINDELEEQNILEIENIFEINNKFNYPKELPVFYIQDELNNTKKDKDNELFNVPLSTNKIKELLKKKVFKPFLLNVKLIDIFSMKNHPPFSFFSFNEILEKNWSKNLEYSTLFLNIHNKLIEVEKEKEKEKEREKEKEKEKERKKNLFKENKKPKKVENKKNKKEEEMTLNLNFSEFDKSGFNDLSLSIIKQLEGINLSKKQVEKITSIIEEVEEDEWTEIKSKKKEKEVEKSMGIVGLEENKQNKKNKKIQKKKNNYINDNNILIE